MTDNSNMVHHLKLDDREIIILGTAHVSKESADLVKTVIERETPDTVCVELCESRFQSIRQKARWQDMDIVKVIKEKKTFLLLSNLLLASFQKRIAEKFDIKPEVRTALLLQFLLVAFWGDTLHQCSGVIRFQHFCVQRAETPRNTQHRRPSYGQVQIGTAHLNTRLQQPIDI